jgi:hypothetical protein
LINPSWLCIMSSLMTMTLSDWLVSTLFSVRRQPRWLTDSDKLLIFSTRDFIKETWEPSKDGGKKFR